MASLDSFSTTTILPLQLLSSQAKDSSARLPPAPQTFSSPSPSAPGSSPPAVTTTALSLSPAVSMPIPHTPPTPISLPLPPSPSPSTFSRQSRSLTPSPSPSRYQSPFGSPTKRGAEEEWRPRVRLHSQRLGDVLEAENAEEDEEEEEEEESDVEIYLHAHALVHSQLQARGVVRDDRKTTIGVPQDDARTVATATTSGDLGVFQDDARTAPIAAAPGYVSVPQDDPRTAIAAAVMDHINAPQDNARPAPTAATPGRIGVPQENQGNATPVRTSVRQETRGTATPASPGCIYPASPPGAPTHPTIPLPDVDVDAERHATRNGYSPNDALHEEEQEGLDYPSVLEGYYTHTPVLGSAAEGPFGASPSAAKRSSAAAAVQKRTPPSPSSNSNSMACTASSPTVHLPTRARERPLTHEDVFPPPPPTPKSTWNPSSSSSPAAITGVRISDPGVRTRATPPSSLSGNGRDASAPWASASNTTTAGAGLGFEGLNLSSMGGRAGFGAYVESSGEGAQEQQHAAAGTREEEYRQAFDGKSNHNHGNNSIGATSSADSENGSGMSLSSGYDAPQGHSGEGLTINVGNGVNVHSSTTSYTHSASAAAASTYAANAPSTSSTGGTYTSTTQRTPNVYINGLPPHFPEDQLFALAVPFGEVRSVRTFTRHVRESESGYGFVLFETVDSAERCINALRKYPNLHPTFSKQIHKIPGTAYLHPSSQAQAQLQTHPHSLSLSPRDSPVGGSSTVSLPDDGESASFKAKMEALHDPTSTNLYMEGLPLSIDEPTLTSLVSPHRISSSRFFQTRLSNPPRIIAFVRLETREGAEEIIGRLHGRMVRGWNDAGSRISVRFADTSEQRELRRAERANKDGGTGDASPSRITIAQAALLNLHGQDLKAAPAQATSKYRGQAQQELLGLHAQHGRDIPPTSSSTRLPAFEVDYSFAPLPAKPNSMHAPSPGHAHARLPPTSTPVMDPAMATLLETLRNSGVPFHSAGMEDEYTPRRLVDEGQHMGSQLHHPHLYQQSLPFSRDSAEWQYGRPAHTRTGYTPAEEYIMRSHAEALHLHGRERGAAMGEAGHEEGREYLVGNNPHIQGHGHHVDPLTGSVVVEGREHPVYAEAQRRRPVPLDLVRRREEGESQPQSQPQHRRRQDSEGSANIAMGVRGYRTQAAAIAFAPWGKGQQGVAPVHDEIGAGLSGSTMMDEEKFHASAGDYAPEQPHDRARPPSLPRHTAAAHNSGIHPPHVNARLARGWGSLHDLSSEHPSPQLSNSYQNAHVRSTTHPHQSSTQQPQHRHYQHSSMSIPSSKNSTYDHEHEPRLANNNRNSNNKNSSTNNYSNNSPKAHSHSQHAISPTTAYQDPSNSNIYDPSEAISPALTASSLISPTLSFSPQTPASTLSPSTPFFGSFGSGAQIAEGFAERIHGITGIGMGIPDEVVQKKVRAGSH